MTLTAPLLCVTESPLGTTDSSALACLPPHALIAATARSILAGMDAALVALQQQQQQAEPVPGYVAVLDDDVALHQLSLMCLVDALEADPKAALATGALTGWVAGWVAVSGSERKQAECHSVTPSVSVTAATSLLSRAPPAITQQQVILGPTCSPHSCLPTTPPPPSPCGLLPGYPYDLVGRQQQQQQLPYPPQLWPWQQQQQPVYPVGSGASAPPSRHMAATSSWCSCWCPTVWAGALASHAIAAWHLPLRIGFSTAPSSPFVWGGAMVLRAADLGRDGCSGGGGGSGGGGDASSCRLPALTQVCTSCLL
jgi:hypothetical protein